MKRPIYKITNPMTGVSAALLVITLLSANCRKNEDPIPLKERNFAILNAGDADTTETPDFSIINWGLARSMPIGAHEFHGEVVNGKLYVFGGYDITKRPNYWTPTKRAFVYDPVADTWTTIADLPHLPKGRNFGGVTHVGVTTNGINIYFAGGYISNADGTDQVFGTKQVWRYNVGTNTYTRLPDLPEELATGQLKYLNGRLHYMGGANLARQDINTHLVLDLSNLNAGWKPLAPLLNGVNHPGSAVLNGKIYFMGGSHFQDENAIPQKMLEVYDEASDTWTKLANMPKARDHISSSVVTIGDRILVLGGETSHDVTTNRVSAYSPATNSWAELTPFRVGKSAGVGAVIDGVIYYVGGDFAVSNHKGTSLNVSNVATAGFPPVADAFVRDGSYSSVNYGTDTLLNVKGAYISDFTRLVYLKFSLNGVSGVSSARLRLYGSNKESSANINLACYGVSDDTWTEGGICFNNAPTKGTGILATAEVSTEPKYIEFDVTNFVESQVLADKVVSFLIKDVGNKNTGLQFNSKENINNPPQLVINQ